MEPSPFLAYCSGVSGSVLLELWFFCSSIGPRGGLPGKYKTWYYWLGRSLLALTAAFVAMLHYSPALPLYTYAFLAASIPGILARQSQLEDDTKD